MMSSITYYNKSVIGKLALAAEKLSLCVFADDIDALAEEEQELEALIESLDITSTS